MSKTTIFASLTLLLAAAVGVGVAPSASASGTVESTVASSANIRCDPQNSDAETKADVATVRDDIGGVLGTQESCDNSTGGSVFEDTVAVLGPTWSNYHPDHVDVPMFWLTKWWNETNEGYTTISTTYNRHLTWVRLVRTDNGVVVVRVNTHWSACGECTAWQNEQSATIDEIKTLTTWWPHAAVVITGDFNDGQAQVLGTSINGHAVHYDAGSDSEQVIHLVNSHITRTGDLDVQCQTCYPSGPLYTDHAAVGESYTLAP